jgi:hypothetical protein
MFKNSLNPDFQDLRINRITHQFYPENPKIPLILIQTIHSVNSKIRNPHKMSLKNSILLTPEEYNEQAQHVDIKSIIENGFHIIETPIKLYTNNSNIVLFTETPNKLYRGGNASVPRLDNARIPKDIEVFYTHDIAYLIKIEAFISSLSIIPKLKSQTEWVPKYGRNLWLDALAVYQLLTV